MGFGMGMSLAPVQQQTLSQRQTMRASLSQAHLLTLRIQLLEALHPGGRFQPRGKCPGCEHQLNEVEILKGFLPDPTDTTTKCPKCSRRFQPRLVSGSMAASIELPFYCELQTVEKLRSLGPLTFETFEKEHPAVLASARFYWGCLKIGFEQANITYLFDPPLLWQDKVGDFLGKCPNTLIAEVCNVSVSAVRRLRVTKKIAVYRRNKQKNTKDN